MKQHKILIRILALITGTALISGCAGTKNISYGNRETGVMLSYHPDKGQVFSYEVTSDITGSNERDGKTYENVQHSLLRFSLEAQKPDSLVPFIFTADTISYYFSYGERKRTMDLSMLVNKRIKMFCTRQGKYLRDMTAAIDSIPKPESAGQRALRGNPVRYLFPGFTEVPSRKLVQGESWTETKHDTIVTEGTPRGSKTTRYIERENTYNVSGFEIRQDRMCVHFTIESLFVMDTINKGKNMTMTSEEDGESVTEVWFDYKTGMPVQVTMTSFTEGSRAYSGQYSGTMPFTRDTKQSVRLLK